MFWGRGTSDQVCCWTKLCISSFIASCYCTDLEAAEKVLGSVREGSLAIVIEKTFFFTILDFDLVCIEWVLSVETDIYCRVLTWEEVTSGCNVVLLRDYDWVDALELNEAWGETRPLVLSVDAEVDWVTIGVDCPEGNNIDTWGSGIEITKECVKVLGCTTGLNACEVGKAAQLEGNEDNCELGKLYSSNITYLDIMSLYGLMER